MSPPIFSKPMLEQQLLVYLLVSEDLLAQPW